MEMGRDFRNRLKDGVPTCHRNLWLRPEGGCEHPSHDVRLLGEQCQGCDRVFDLAELLDGYCDDCWPTYVGQPDDPRDEYTFVRDFRS